jgi:hypothetical protein
MATLLGDDLTALSRQRNEGKLVPAVFFLNTLLVAAVAIWQSNESWRTHLGTSFSKMASSFVTEGRKRIHARSPPGREVRSDLRGDRHQHDGSPTVAGSVAVKPNNIDCTHRAAAHAAGRPDANVNDHEACCIAEHQADDAGRLRAERDANADLLRAPRDRVCEQTVESDTREREQRESTRGRRHHALLHDRGGDLRGECAHLDRLTSTGAVSSRMEKRALPNNDVRGP